MAHLSGFGLENFRVFKEYTWFDFAPITILVGPNNSGKSSLIKALLLLKDNVEKGLLPVGYEHIDTYQDEERYEEYYEPIPIRFSNLIHGLNSPLAVKSKQTDNDKLSFLISYVLRRPRPTPPARGSGGLSNKKAYYHLVFQIDPESDKANPIHRVEVLGQNQRVIIKITDTTIYFDPIEYDNTVYYDNQKISPKIGTSSNYKKTIDSSSWVNIESWFLLNKIDEEKAKKLSDEIIFYLGLSELDENKKTSGPALNILKSLSYWSTSRNEQKRIFSDDEKSNTKLLLDEYEESQATFDSNNFMNYYVRLFNLPGTIQSTYEPEKGIYFPNIENTSLINFGFGYTQIGTLLFKIATHIFRNSDSMFGFSEESVLILEEPEVNLHPSFQSKLADLFAKSIENDRIQFIIETHSEYLIRKLQYLIAQTKAQPDKVMTPLKPEDVIIYYFYDSAEEKKPLKITIDEDGSLSDDFGPGFYDEAATWELELLKLKRKKNRQN